MAIPYKAEVRLPVHALHHCAIEGAVSPIARSCGSRNQELQKGVDHSLTVSPCDPLTKVLLPVPTTLRSAGLEVLVPKGGILPQETQQ